MKLSQRHRFQRIVNTLGETSRVPHDLSYFVYLIVDYGKKKPDVSINNKSCFYLIDSRAEQKRRIRRGTRNRVYFQRRDRRTGDNTRLTSPDQSDRRLTPPCRG